MSDQLFTREEALSGFPTRRARTLLFVLEARAAYLSSRTKITTMLVSAPELTVWMPILAGEEALIDTDLDKNVDALFRAFEQERDGDAPPGIVQLERYAPQWANLVPNTPRLRAALVRLIAQKYRLVRNEIPDLRIALGMDDMEVKSAYEQLYGEAIEAVYIPRKSFADRLKQLITGK
jgi:hypothetical protein